MAEYSRHKGARVQRVPCIEFCQRCRFQTKYTMHPRHAHPAGGVTGRCAGSSASCSWNWNRRCTSLRTLSTDTTPSSTETLSAEAAHLRQRSAEGCSRQRSPLANTPWGRRTDTDRLTSGVVVIEEIMMSVLLRLKHVEGATICMISLARLLPISGVHPANLCAALSSSERRSADVVL